MPGHRWRSGWVRVMPSMVSVRALGALAVTITVPVRVAAGLGSAALGSGSAAFGPGRTGAVPPGLDWAGSDRVVLDRAGSDLGGWRMGGTAMMGPLRLAEPR